MIHITGNVHIPSDSHTDPRFILPDEVVSISSEHFDLLKSGMRGIDPMCGVGTFSRVINRAGGRCDGIEIDPVQCAVAKREVGAGSSIVQGDFRKTHMTAPYDYIFTSMPFAWFKKVPCGLDESFARALRALLKPGGFMLMDTLEIAEREGETWPLGASQRDYLERHGFQTGESLRFSARVHHDTGEFIVTKFLLKPTV